MHLLLFSIFAICIAGSRSQELAIGTEYLRAHFNNSLSFESGLNAQGGEVPPIDPGNVNEVPSPSTTVSTSSTTKDDDDESPEHHDHDDHEHADHKHKKYAHAHKTHHEHEATISVDVHNLVDILKQELHAIEERIIAAISHHDHDKSPATKLKSYTFQKRN